MAKILLSAVPLYAALNRDIVPSPFSFPKGGSGKESDPFLIPVCISPFHFDPVKDDIALFGIGMGDKTGCFEFFVFMSEAAAGNILITGNSVSVRGKRPIGGGPS